MRTNALIIQQIKLRKHKEEEGIKRPLALTYKSHVSVHMYPYVYVYASVSVNVSTDVRVLCVIQFL